MRLVIKRLVNEISCLIERLLMFVDANAHFFPPASLRGELARLLALGLDIAALRRGFKILGRCLKTSQAAFPDFLSHFRFPPPRHHPLLLENFYLA